MMPPELLKDYQVFCKGLKPHLNKIKTFRTQKATDEAYIAITDQVAIMIGYSVDQRELVKKIVSPGLDVSKALTN